LRGWSDIITKVIDETDDKLKEVINLKMRD
jgi:hypothetical protein